MNALSQEGHEELPVENMPSLSTDEVSLDRR